MTLEVAQRKVGGTVALAWNRHRTMISAMNDDFLTDFPEEGSEASPEDRPKVFVPGGLVSEIPAGRAKAILTS